MHATAAKQARPVASLVTMIGALLRQAGRGGAEVTVQGAAKGLHQRRGFEERARLSSLSLSLSLSRSLERTTFGSIAATPF
jgi:hypothetical protein